MKIKYLETKYITNEDLEKEAVLKKTLQIKDVKIAIIKKQTRRPFTLVEFYSGKSLSQDFLLLKEAENEGIKRVQDFSLNQKNWEILKEKISTFKKINN